MGRNTQPSPEVEEVVVRKSTKAAKTARSYLVAVRTKSNRTEWAHNGLRFPSVSSADRYGKDLELRWSIMVAYEVQPSDDPSNASYPVPSDRYLIDRQV